MFYLTLLHNSPSLSKGREGLQARYLVAVTEGETMETFVLSLHSTQEQPPKFSAASVSNAILHQSSINKMLY